MCSLYQLRGRVDSLRRKLAPEIAVIRLCRQAEEFCHQWAAEVANRKPAPEPRPFIRKLGGAGFRLTTWMALHNYIERCRYNNEPPEVWDTIVTLLPWTVKGGDLNDLQWDSAAG